MIIIKKMATVVTCYYRIPSKHSSSEYDSWIKNLLDNFSVKSKMIIFTSKSLETYFRDLIGERTNFVIYYRELNELEVFQKYNWIWRIQYMMDPQKDIRSIGCYVIWNSKFDFLKEAIERNPFNSDKFVWSDIGNFRDISNKHLLKSFPDYAKISGDKLDIVKVSDFPDKDFFFHETHLSGSIFGSGKSTILKIRELFFEMFEKYIDNNKFIGCDQQILTSVYCKNKELFNIVECDTELIDKWFYLYSYYSHSQKDLKLKMALIGPGIMSIPPQGWGAVEILIWDYYNELRKRNIDVDIINEICSNYFEQSDPNSDYTRNLIHKINSGNYDFVHIHYDVLFHIIPHLNAKKIGFSSHYPYIDQIDKHASDGYDKIFKFIISNKKNINFVLAKKDKEFLEKNGAMNVYLLENGIDYSQFNLSMEPSKFNRTVYLGKIDKRKNQSNYQDIDCIDFVGPLNDDQFNISKNYLGMWTRGEVQSKLTEYGNLLLVSNGEADPLIVKEAIMSGLGVVINDSSAKNLEEREFITILDNNRVNDLEYVREKIEENRRNCVDNREKIRHYGILNFSWDKLLNNYLGNIMSEPFGMTIVTTLIDIRREELGDGRKISEYLEWFKETLKLNCNMYVFVEEKFVEFVMNNRPKNYNTRIVVTSIEHSYYYKYINQMRQIVTSQEYRVKIAHPNRVECVLPEYNVIQYSKFGWLDFAIDENKFSSSYFFWLDAGASRFFNNVDLTYPFKNEKLLEESNQKFIIQKRLDLEYYPINEDFIWKSDNLMKGGMFGGHQNIVKIIGKKVEEKFQGMLRNNNVNNEQLAIAMVWKENPDLFYLIDDKNQKPLDLLNYFLH